MATVYLAEDLKHRRKVAVKVLRPDLAASLGPERFLREVTIAATWLLEDQDSTNYSSQERPELRRARAC